MKRLARAWFGFRLALWRHGVIQWKRGSRLMSIGGADPDLGYDTACHHAAAKAQAEMLVQAGFQQATTDERRRLGVFADRVASIEAQSLPLSMRYDSDPRTWMERPRGDA